MESSTPPCPPPVRPTVGWPSVAIETEGHRISFRLPPALRLREREPRSSSRSVGSGGPYLLDLWQAATDRGTRFLAIWAYNRPGFPAGDHPPEHRPERHDWATCVERIAGRDVHIATWRTTLQDGPTIYSTAAHWVLGDGVWIQLAADAHYQEEQEETLALLRTLSIEPLR